LSTCRATFDGRELTIANSHMKRKWRFDNGLLYATSLSDRDASVEWLERPSIQPAPYPAAALADEVRTATFTRKAGKAGPVEAESLVVDLVTSGSVELRYRFQVFLEGRGISARLTAGAGPAAKTEASAAANATGVEVDRPRQERQAKFIADAMEVLGLA
jgi:hypothetical protein